VTVVYPDAIPTLGNTKVKAVVAIADMLLPKLATEINAASSVDISCFLYPAGWSPTGSTAKGTKPLRLCNKSAQEQLNRTTYSLADLQYVYAPQGVAAAPANAAKTLLASGTSIYLVERLGLDSDDTPFVVGQLTRVHYVTLGDQIVGGDRTDENGEFMIMQAAVYRGAGPVDGTIAT